MRACCAPSLQRPRAAARTAILAAAALACLSLVLSFTKIGKARRKHHTPTILSVTVNAADKPATVRERIRL